jgi:hypothetical protein
MVGQHEAHVQHRHQRLSAGQQLGVLVTGQQIDGLGDRAGIVIAERRRLHARHPASDGWDHENARKSDNKCTDPLTEIPHL